MCASGICCLVWMNKGSNEEDYWQACTIISRLDSGVISFSLFPSIIFSSLMLESSILFNLSSSSKTGWKYSWRLNKGIGGGGIIGSPMIPPVLFFAGIWGSISFFGGSSLTSLMTVKMSSLPIVVAVRLLVLVLLRAPIVEMD
jgi:hypothetical protein